MGKCEWWHCTDEAREGGRYCSDKCKNKSAVDRRRRKVRLRLVELAGGKCIRCGYDRCVAALDFHHRDPSTKSFGINSGYTYSFARMSEEAAKCDLLCANCHREVEQDLRDTDSRYAGAGWSEVRSAGIHRRECVQCHTVFNTKTRTAQTCSRECRAQRRFKIVWPAADVLAMRVAQTGYEQVGRELGVSGKAVKMRLVKMGS